MERMIPHRKKYKVSLVSTLYLLQLLALVIILVLKV